MSTSRMDRVRVAVEGKRAGGVRSALQDADESERAELLGPVTLMLREWRSRQRQDSQWWPQVQCAEQALIGCEGDSSALRKRLATYAYTDEVHGTVEDRRPAWMADVMEDFFASRLPGDIYADTRWEVAERYRLVLGGPRRLDERNVVPLGLSVGRQTSGSPGRRLIGVLRDHDDAGDIALAVLRSPHLARISAWWWENDHIRRDGWPPAIAGLVREGRIDRTAALEAGVEALGLPGATAPARTQRIMTAELLAPTAHEVEALRPRIEALAQGAPAAVARWAKAALAT